MISQAVFLVLRGNKKNMEYGLNNVGIPVWEKTDFSNKAKTILNVDDLPFFQDISDTTHGVNEFIAHHLENLIPEVIDVNLDDVGE